MQPERNIGSRLKRAWNAFLDREALFPRYDPGRSYSSRPDRPRFSGGNQRSIVTAVYNRIALDVSSIDVRHVRLDTSGRYLEDMTSSLNECLSLQANKDQTGRELVADIVVSMLDEGSVAVVPVETTGDPMRGSSYEIHSLRTGRILEWKPSHVRVRLYDDRIGEPAELVLPKSMVAVVTNPFYSVVNEPNSTLQRLIRKTNLLDVVDEQSSAGKLDLIIQLPYSVKTPAKQEWAEKRRAAIEEQLAGSKYGIAYADSTERITQLNRPIENNLMKQVEYLTAMLYSQLGISQGVLDGTADDKTMQNYYARTIEPIVLAVVEEFRRKFLTKTARTQGQSIEFYRDPFRLIPVGEVAEIADKMIRNEIMTANEMRAVLGRRPSDDPRADQLLNPNISQSDAVQQRAMFDGEYEENQNG